jgi:hypothetical protein
MNPRAPGEKPLGLVVDSERGRRRTAWQDGPPIDSGYFIRGGGQLRKGALGRIVRVS